MSVVECKTEMRSESGPLLAHEIRNFLAELPDGAVISAVMKDFGSQRDPDERLIGLRASWSEVRPSQPSSESVSS